MNTILSLILGAALTTVSWNKLKSWNQDPAQHVGREVRFRACVTHVSTLRPGLAVVASTSYPYRAGLELMLPPGQQEPEEGDVAWFQGGDDQCARWPCGERVGLGARAADAS